MANAVEKLNTIAITDIEKVNTITDANLEDLNTLEFTGAAPDAHTLIATATASGSATLEFTSGIDSTYDVYEFQFVNLHPSTDTAYPSFKASINGGTDYGVATTTSFFQAYHHETSGAASLGYVQSYDAAQSTDRIQFGEGAGFDNDQSMSGVLTLYDPSSTTFVKHFMFKTNTVEGGNYSVVHYVAGYVNTTSAVDAISFFFHSGNIDTGEIKMYGLAKS